MLKTTFCDEIVEYCKNHSSLFQAFDQVYLFGSTVKGTDDPSDLDFLLVYDFYSDAVIEAVNHLEKQLKDLFHLPIDTTILSEKELRETDFLPRIQAYISIK